MQDSIQYECNQSRASKYNITESQKIPMSLRANAMSEAINAQGIPKYSETVDCNAYACFAGAQ